MKNISCNDTTMFQCFNNAYHLSKLLNILLEKMFRKFHVAKLSNGKWLLCKHLGTGRAVDEVQSCTTWGESLFIFLIQCLPTKINLIFYTKLNFHFLLSKKTTLLCVLYWSAIFRQLLTNCFSVFDHFVGLELKGLRKKNNVTHP